MKTINALTGPPLQLPTLVMCTDFLILHDHYLKAKKKSCRVYREKTLSLSKVTSMHVNLIDRKSNLKEEVTKTPKT